MRTVLPLYGLSLAFVLAMPSQLWGQARLSRNWVGSWACSPQLVEVQNRPPAPGLDGNTLRQVIHTTLGGKRVRLRFSNEFGSAPLTLRAVHLALPVAGGANSSYIRVETDRALTFGGRSSVVIPAGAPMFSDPIEFDVAALSDVVVTVRAGEVPQGITGHPGSRETSYLATGDQVGAANLADAKATDHWYLLDGLDVEVDGNEASIVALGDSITDGRGSIVNGNTRWPDDLARTLAANRQTAGRGVLNEGIGGNRILREGLGPSALARFDRDVIAQSGVRWVIVFEGVNDLGGIDTQDKDGAPSAIADDVIFALEQFILRAHTHGLKIYGGTITAFGKSSYASALNEAARGKVNAWIRADGHFDAVIDFDRATRDKASPDQLAPKLDSGDHLHLNSDGYKAMAEAIDLKLFTY